MLGVVGAVMVLGILAAVAIPSFLDYQRKSKRSEAELNLRAIEKAALRAFAENAAFPTGTAGPTPAAPCCTEAGRRCRPDPTLWQDAPWTELDFEVVAPHYYQYAYTGTADGQRFTATATGDLDCDGVEVVYQLVGSVAGGSPTFALVRPARAD